MKHLLFGLTLCATAVLILLRGLSYSEPRFTASEFEPSTADSAAPVIEQGFVFTESVTPEVHSGTLVELSDGSLLAAWFGGSREGAQDVAIHAARREGKTWSAPFVITDRPGTGRELSRYIRKLGNPVLLLDKQQRLWLFYVTVSIGGWSTSSIAYKISTDDGRSWSPAQTLISSPFLNLSTLVRARPLLYSDGGIALPVYHELAGKFGELLHIGSDGKLIDKARMGSGRSVIQPSLLVADPTRSMALLRRVGSSPRRVMLSHSDDGGLNWDKPEPTNLPNPDASVAALNSTDGEYLLVYNHSEQGRANLSLARSSDGLRWQKLFDLENGQGKNEFSYPYLIRSHNGDYHLIYTWQRRRMAYARFNQSWLESLK